MTITGQLLVKLTGLTEEQQRRVLEYVERLKGEGTKPLVDPYGSCADLRTDLPLEEFQKNSAEMWGDRTDPDGI